MSQADSKTAIFYAFAANFGISIVKTIMAVWTGSGSLLAESIHSYADCSNQVLLYIGLKRSAKQATNKHPMGFGRESYIWSMMVAMILFTMGGVFSVYEGWLHLQHPEPVGNMGIALLVLLIAVALECVSLKGATAAMEVEKGDRTLWQWFKSTHSSELLVVVGEDVAALLGLVLALLALGLTMLTGNVAFDAIGSMLIGVLLIIVAFVIGVEVHSLLVGEADEATTHSVTQYLQTQPEVLRIFNVWAINHGREVMLSIKAELKPNLSVAQAVTAINAMEKNIKLRHQRVRWVFFEMDDQD